MEFQITKETSSFEQNKKKTLMIVKYSNGLKQIRFTKALFYIQRIYDKVNIPVFITQSVKASTGTKLKALCTVFQCIFGWCHGPR